MSSHKPQNVLITGGCGFIGSNFVNFIHNHWQHANFVNVDKLILNSDALYIDEEVRNSSRFKQVFADIKNKVAITAALEENQIDTIIHFAADCTSTRCYEETEEAIENNVISFIYFLEAVRDYGKVKRFLHLSTDEVYGDSGLSSDEIAKTEDTPLRPGNPYAATKIAAEAYANLFRLKYKLPIVMVRMNNVYGPNQWNVKVVPRFIEIAKENGTFTIQGSGQQLRSWLFVDDASEGLATITEKGLVGEVYNLGTYFEMNVADLAKYLQKEVDQQLGRTPTEAKFKSIPDRPYNDMRYLIDITKIESLGWKPKISFEEGMRRTVASALKEKNQCKMVVAIYGGRGYVGRTIQDSLKLRKIPFKLAEKKVGFCTDQEAEAELATLNVTHVICVTGRTHGKGINTIEYLEGGADRVYENVRDNLYSATTLAHMCRRLGIHYTYVGTGYIFAYDQNIPERAIGGIGFKESDEPTFFGSSYSVAKGFTDRQMSYFNQKGWENINARITLPLSFDLQEPRNLLSKLIHYKQLFDIPVSITILPDCNDAMITLMENRYGGTLNLVNPDAISLFRIVQLYKQFVDDNVNPEAIGVDTDKARELLATKGNCALATTRLTGLVNVPTAEESLSAVFKTMAKAQ